MYLYRCNATLYTTVILCTAYSLLCKYNICSTNQFLGWGPLHPRSFRLTAPLRSGSRSFKETYFIIVYQCISFYPTFSTISVNIIYKCILRKKKLGWFFTIWQLCPPQLYWSPNKQDFTGGFSRSRGMGGDDLLRLTMSNGADACRSLRHVPVHCTVLVPQKKSVKHRIQVKVYEFDVEVSSMRNCLTWWDWLIELKLLAKIWLGNLYKTIQLSL